MTVSQWLGIAALIFVLALVGLAFRQGMKVKPDENRKPEDWSRTTMGGF